MKPKDCIDLIKKMKTVDFSGIDEKNEFIDKMEVPIKGLKYGKTVMLQFRGMLLGENYEGAEKFLRKAILTSKYWPYNKLSFKTMGSIMWVIFLLLAVSIVFLILGGRISHLAKESVNWPQTEGVILKSYYYEDEYEDDEGDVRIRWMTVIEYSYVADRQSYRSKRIGFIESRSFDDSLDAKTYCNNYPVNSKATVYYNPKNYHFAVLKPGLETRFHIYTIVGLMFLGMTVFSTVLSVIVVVSNMKEDYYDEIEDNDL